MTRLLTATFIASVVAYAFASLDAVVYTLDATARNGQALSIGGENARLWLANRLGLSSFYSLEQADTNTLSLLNQYEDDQEPLFSPAETKSRKLVIIEGVQSPEDFFDREEATPAFHISNPPLPSSNAQLAMHLLDHDRIRRGSSRRCRGNTLKQLKGVISGGFSASDPAGFCVVEPITEIDNSKDSLADATNVIYGGAFEMADAYQEQSIPPSITSSYTGIFHVAILLNIAEEKGIESSAYREAVKKVKEASKAYMAGLQVTIVCMPPPAGRTKRNAGEYEAFEAQPNANLRKEQPLSKPASPSASQPAQSANPSNLTIPKTTIPSCFSSKAACILNTVDCSGHGSCIKKYTEKVSEDEEGPECWACSCDASRIKNNDFTKTIYWGGPACQKKDISVPFFLFAGFTVAAVAAVSYGIGLLYSIGEEDLPSVLGAGVAPTIRK